MNFLLHFLATLFVFVSLDVLWLKVIIRGLVDYPAVYHYGYPPNWALAEIYYVFVAVWLTFGAGFKSMVYNDAAPAFIDGWKVGFRFALLYAAINVTFVQSWPLELIIMDIAWNTFAYAATAVASYGIGNWLLNNNNSAVSKRS